VRITKKKKKQKKIIIFFYFQKKGSFDVEKSLVSDALKAPNVTVTIVYGSQINTVVAANYSDYSFSQPTMEYVSSGDGKMCCC
jgi:hypothetical protein